MIHSYWSIAQPCIFRATPPNATLEEKPHRRKQAQGPGWTEGASDSTQIGQLLVPVLADGMCVVGGGPEPPQEAA